MIVSSESSDFSPPNGQMNLKRCDPESLKPHPDNYNQHPPEQIEHLKASLSDFDQVKNIVVWNGLILAGHGLVEAAIQAGRPAIEYLDVSDWPEEKARAFLFVDNETARMGQPDYARLQALVEEAKAHGQPTHGVTPERLAEIAAEARAANGNGAGGDTEPQIDKAAELQEIWQVKLGDLWACGEHRVICGDCTDAAVVERVMGGERAAMLNADPIYGVDYSGQNSSMFYGKNKKGKTTKRLKNDETIEKASLIITEALNLLPCPVVFLWHAPQFHDIAKQSVFQVGYTVFSVIVWNKNHANFGAMGARYKPKFEMALACKADTIPWYGPDNEVTVWDIDRKQRNENHPTEKPVSLFERAIRNHTTRNEIIVDNFSGSGTTLIACENLNRRCRAIEIEPKYVAVTLQRFLDHTGIQPHRLEAA